MSFFLNMNKKVKVIVKKHKFSKKELAESPSVKSIILHLKLIKNDSGYLFDIDSEIEIAKLLYWNNINANTREFEKFCSHYFAQLPEIFEETSYFKKKFKQFFDKIKSASLSKSDIIASLIENDKLKLYISEIDSIIADCKAKYSRIENIENVIKNKCPELFLTSEELALELIKKLHSADIGQAIPLSDKTVALLAEKIDEWRSNLPLLRTEIMEYLADYELHIPKYCASCGNQVSLSAKFCNQCGAEQN